MRRFIRYTSLIGAVLGLGVGVMGSCYDGIVCIIPFGSKAVVANLGRHRAFCGVGTIPPNATVINKTTWRVHRNRPLIGGPHPWFSIEWKTTGKSIGFPAILPFILFTLIFALTFIRRRKPGHCRCGYSLEGLTSEKCPECGRECEV
jgi:hypothetical protein